MFAGKILKNGSFKAREVFFFNPGHSPLVAMETMERKNMQFFVSFGKDFGERNK